MARPPVSRTVDVLLVSLAPDVREISALLASAGHRIVETIVQRRDRPDTRTFVGRETRRAPGPCGCRRNRRGRLQRRTPADDALPARAGTRGRVLRPLAGPPRTLRAARLEPGGKAPGRARPPPVRDTPAPRVDPRGRCRRAARLHGRRRAPRRRVLRNREAADQEDPGRTRRDSAGAGPAAGPSERTP